MKDIIKKPRHERKKYTGEVFTPLQLVDNILDQLPIEAWQENKTFLDSSAGNGNFLIEVYRYKVEKYNHNPTIALSTIYGVELMPDNTAEMRLRLFKQAVKYGVNPQKAVEIIKNNIVCADALMYDFSFENK